MRIMTSVEAQNHFGELIDAAQREPVTITRRGTPVARLVPVAGPTRAEALRRLTRLRSRLAQHGPVLSREEILSARDEGRR